jgi:hypothetical protein
MAVVELYDDTKKILMRYSQTQDDSLSKFFKLKNEENAIPGTALDDLEFVDFRVFVRTKTKIDVASATSVLKEARTFGISNKDALSIWLNETSIKLGKPAYAALKEADKNFSETRIELNSQEFKKEVIKKRGEQDRKIKRDDDLVATFPSREEVVETLDLDPVSSEPSFLIEREEFEFSGVVERGKYDLVEIFDDMNASKSIPFIFLWRGKGQNPFIKVYEDVTPKESWYPRPASAPEGEVEKDKKILDEDTFPIGLHFKVLTGESTNEYANCLWTNEANIRVDYKTRKKDVKGDIAEAIKESFEDDRGPVFRMNPILLDLRSVSISGTFISEIKDFNKYVMSFLIFNKSYPPKKNLPAHLFAFLNENTNTETLKEKTFRVYTELNQSWNTIESLQFGISSAKGPEDNFFSIRIKHCRDLVTAKSGIRLFQVLLFYYHRLGAGILNYYQKYPTISKKILKVTIKAAPKKNQKTKERLADLKKHNPSLFRDGYSSQCQSPGQPYVVANVNIDGSVPAEVTKLKKALKDGENKVMVFDGTYYACEKHPREPGNKKIWPVLKKNTDTVTPNPDYREEFPCLPCCAAKKKERYTSGANLKKDDCGEGFSAQKEKEKLYVSKSKNPEPGKLSAMPHTLARLAKNIGMQMSEKKKGRDNYPYIRYGVMESPRSFFHCMEVATGSKVYFRAAGDSQKEKVVDQAIEKMLDFYPVGAQQFFDEYIGRLKRDLLKNPISYLEPSKWVTLAEKYYHVNVVLVQNDEEDYLGGEFLYPRASKALLPKRVPDRGTVVIFRSKVKNWPLQPYQCNLLRKLPEETMMFRGDNFVGLLEGMYQKSWDVYSVSAERLWKYERDILTENNWKE